MVAATEAIWSGSPTLLGLIIGFLTNAIAKSVLVRPGAIAFILIPVAINSLESIFTILSNAAFVILQTPIIGDGVSPAIDDITKMFAAPP